MSLLCSCVLRYNAAIYGTTAANRYQVALVTNDFIKGGWWDANRAASAIPFGDPEQNYLKFWGGMNVKAVEPTKRMQNNVGELVRLENKECAQVYTTKFQSMWGDVLVVTSKERNDTVIQIWNHDPGFNDYGDPGYDDQFWVCTGRVDFRISPPECDVSALVDDASQWTIRNVAQCRNPGPGSCQSFDAPVEYCLATRTPSHCSVRFSPTVLYVVVGCSIMKIACLLSTLFIRNFEPIATFGDAVSSFIQQADPITNHAGFLSNKFGGVECEPRTRRWLSTMGSCRALLCFGA